MRKTLSIFLALFLSACANDRYTATTGDPAMLQSTLHTCKSDVEWRYAYSNRYQTMAAGLAGGAIGGAATGGAAGGAIAGGVMGAAASLPADRPMQLSEMNPALERCMADHGYIGTSEN